MRNKEFEMAYMNQEKKAKIAAKIKPLLKRYGLKGSLAVRNHSTIVLNLKSGKIDFGGDRIQVNTYWAHEQYTGVAKEFLVQAIKELKSADWYDESDAQVDYFNTAYYVDINVGQWDKPYQIIA
jgi:outer membrane protease